MQDDGTTALMKAVSFGVPIQLLLDCPGIDVTLKDWVSFACIAESVRIISLQQLRVVVPI